MAVILLGPTCWLIWRGLWRHSPLVCVLLKQAKCFLQKQFVQKKEMKPKADVVMNEMIVSENNGNMVLYVTITERKKNSI